MTSGVHHPVPAGGLKYVDHTYRDFSRYVDGGGQLIKHKKSTNNFPARLHRILSDPENSDVITWMPHGRAWKILDKERLIREVVPNYFVCKKYESFSRQLNGWGFKRLHQSGPDAGCYYHECFLRDLPKLTCLIRRLAPNLGKSMPYAQGEPNFYAIGERYPLPPPGASDPGLESSSETRGGGSGSGGRARAASLESTAASSEAVTLALRHLTVVPASAPRLGGVAFAGTLAPEAPTATHRPSNQDGYYHPSSAHHYAPEQRPYSSNYVSPTYYEEYTGYYDHYGPSQGQLYPQQVNYYPSDLHEQFQPNCGPYGSVYPHEPRPGNEAHVGNHDGGAFDRGFQNGQSALFFQPNAAVQPDSSAYATGYQDGLAVFSLPPPTCVAHPGSTNCSNERIPERGDAGVQTGVSVDPLEPIQLSRANTDGGVLPQTKTD